MESLPAKGHFALEMGRGKRNVTRQDAHEILEMYLRSGAKAAKQLCSIKGFEKSTYYKIINNEGVLPEKEGNKASREKWEPMQIQEVVSYIEDGHQQATLFELIQEFCERRHYPSISVTTMWRYLDGQLITLKQGQQWNQARNSDQTKHERSDYAEWFMANQAKTFVFIDEFGFNLNTIRRLGRAHKKQRVTFTVAQNKGTNLSVMAAVENGHGLLLEHHKSGSMTTDDFEVFLTTLGEAIREQGLQNVVLIYDNCRIHQESVVQQMCWWVDCEYANLPPYSPMLNPIEECINDWKSQIKSLLSTSFQAQRLQVASLPFGQKTAERMKILEAALSLALPVVTPAKVQAHYQHTLSFIPQILAMNDV